MKIPQDIQGGHYGVLFFEKGLTSKEEINGVRLITRVGCLFFIEAKDKIKKAKVRDLKIIANKRLEGKISNSGNVVFIPEGVYYLMSENSVVDRGQIKTLYLPPKETGMFTVDLPKKMKAGRYTLVITFDLQDGDSVVKEMDFYNDVSGQIRILEERD